MAKARKDPSKPKKTTTAWMCFCNANRKELLDKGMKVTEASKELGKMWAELSDEDKEPFVKLVEKDKKRYAKEMENYVPPPKQADDDEDSQEGKKKKKEKKERKPRKPSGYILYGSDQRPNIKKESPDMKAPDVMRAIGAGWKALTEEERGEWNTKAANA